ncbi:MAG: cobalamin biosynthesis protein CbiD [Mogibacterium sp.]|nr:cobalamin biosynthesis protein CbiD [Mogibacterium sp.]
MRNGFTTGSCAAAAAKAAVRMLLTGQTIDRIRIETPKGILYDAELLKITRSEDRVRCAVRKDGGDDPDITTGALIFAEAECTEEPGIFIDGGEGVGRVTRPGLDQPVGAAAINSVPRAMIQKEVQEVLDLLDHDGGIRITISVPGGERLAAKTFNPRLGIEGGISIIGTSGIVEPMSRQAILDTIRVELRQKRAEGHTVALISPGNYGLAFMREAFGVDLDRSVKCSNFIGETVDMIAELGFDGFLLTGHAGKLVKVAGGIMNTHSREADCRMELIAAAAVRAGVTGDVLSAILDCLTTEEAFGVLERLGKREATAQALMEKILYYLRKRAGEEVEAGCVLYSKELGLLAASENAAGMIEAHREQWNG